EALNHPTQKRRIIDINHINFWNSSRPFSWARPLHPRDRHLLEEADLFEKVGNIHKRKDAAASAVPPNLPLLDDPPPAVADEDQARGRRSSPEARGGGRL